MHIGFFTVLRKDPQHYRLAELLVRSIRRIMPDIQITHLTDETSPVVLGVDHVRRKSNGPMLGLRLDHYSECEGDWLLLDTDTLVQHDVRSVFNDPSFDIAIADRNWSHLPPSNWTSIPYNTGVVFSRNPEFWKEASREWYALPLDDRDWMSEQRVVAKVIASNRYRVKVLPGMTYNFPPDLHSRGPSAAILHFKGPRKDWMERWEESGMEKITARPSNPHAQPLRIFIGYDSRQPVAFHVAAHSVSRHASHPVSITSLALPQLPITRRGLTEFTYSRFLVPYLSGYDGISIFMDSDTLCLSDVAELLAHPIAYPNTPVFMVQHPIQRFEWTSLMVFQNPLCTHLTPDFVNSDVHSLFDLKWASSIGALPSRWNHLVGYDSKPSDIPSLIHFTKGIPIWPQTQQSDYADLWHQEFRHMISTCSFDDLMGKSRHTLTPAVNS